MFFLRTGDRSDITASYNQPDYFVDPKVKTETQKELEAIHTEYVFAIIILMYKYIYTALIRH